MQCIPAGVNYIRYWTPARVYLKTGDVTGSEELSR